MTTLDELEKLLKAGTPGPVAFEHRGTKSDIKEGRDCWAVFAEADRYDFETPYLAKVKSKEDAALIVAAINALPGLLESARRVETLKAEVDRLQVSSALLRNALNRIEWGSGTGDTARPLKAHEMQLIAATALKGT
jgi:hypothetical protein